MKRRIFFVLLSVSVFTFMQAKSAFYAAGGEYFYTNVPPGKDDRYYSAEYSVWLPEGAETLRGIIVHQHGCGRNGLSVPHDVHWQALAKKWDCALMGTFYYTGDECQSWFEPKNGSANAFLKAIKNLANLSNHPELVHAPWVLWGHSGGAFWVGKMLNLFPDRIVAAFPRSGGDYNVNPEALKIPVMFNNGAKEPERVNGSTYFTPARKSGGLWSIAPDTSTAHDCGNSRLLAIPFFDACLAQRLPYPLKGACTLKSMDTLKAWLGNVKTVEIAPTLTYAGDRDAAVWLPNETIARKWQELVRTGWVTDYTPPANPPENLRASIINSSTVLLKWNAEADLESGIKTFYIYRNGKRIGKFQGPNDSYNKRGFQYGNYGDEPIPEAFYNMPESWNPTEMKYVDYGLETGKTYFYQISTVNWSDLESEKSRVLQVTITD